MTTNTVQGLFNDIKEWRTQAQRKGNPVHQVIAQQTKITDQVCCARDIQVLGRGQKRKVVSGSVAERPAGLIRDSD